MWTKLGSKQAFLFLQLQLFPLRQAHKVVFGDPEYTEEVRVTEVFLTKRPQDLMKITGKGTKCIRLHFLT